jgi:hypothetical protein
MVQRWKGKGRKSPNTPSSETNDETGKAIKACRGTGKIGHDDDKNDGSTDGRNKLWC